MMTYIAKYAHNRNEKRPERWKTGPDPVEHDKYYSFLKHRTQAVYRGESHSLTWDDWERLWPTEQWLQRGRTKHSLCLMQLDPEAGWHTYNVEVVERIVYLLRSKEYRAKSNDE